MGSASLDLTHESVRKCAFCSKTPQELGGGVVLITSYYSAICSRCIADCLHLLADVMWPEPDNRYDGCAL